MMTHQTVGCTALPIKDSKDSKSKSPEGPPLGFCLSQWVNWTSQSRDFAESFTCTTCAGLGSGAILGSFQLTVQPVAQGARSPHESGPLKPWASPAEIQAKFRQIRLR